MRLNPGVFVLAFAVSGCSDDGGSEAAGTGTGTDTGGPMTESATGSTSEGTTTTDPSTSGPSTTGDSATSLGGSTGIDETTGAPLDRATDGLTVLYRFNAGGGTVIQDISGVGDPLNLIMGSSTVVSWGANTLTVNDAVRLAGAVSPTKITDACGASNELTMEVWVRPQSDVQSGAVVMSLSTAADSRAFTLAQDGGQWEFRLNTGDTSLDGLPAVLVSANVAAMSHVVYTRSSAGAVAVYTDGTEAATDTRDGDFASWPADLAFTLANLNVDSFDFRGEFGLAAVYCRALTPAEVTQNFDAGF